MADQQVALTITANSSRAVSALRATVQELQRLGVGLQVTGTSAKRMDGDFTRLTDRMERCRGVGLALTGAFAGISAALGAVAKRGVDFNVTLQRSTQALTMITGSSRQASRFLADLRKEALSSALEFKQMLPIAQSLAAAYGPGGLGKVIPTMRAFGDAATALGVGREGQERALLGFRQILARGKASQEELNQIVENLPGLNVAGALMSRFGTANTEVLAKAKVTSQQVADTIVEAMQRQFGGAQIKLSGTLPVILSNLGDAWSEFTSQLTLRFTPAITKAVGDILRSFTDLTSDKASLEALRRPFDWLATAATKAADAVKGGIRWYRGLSAETKNLVSVLGTAGVAGTGLLGGLAVLATVLGTVVRNVRELKDALKGLNLAGSLGAALPWLGKRAAQGAAGYLGYQIGKELSGPLNERTGYVDRIGDWIAEQLYGKPELRVDADAGLTPAQRRQKAWLNQNFPVNPFQARGLTLLPRQPGNPNATPKRVPVDIDELRRRERQRADALADLALAEAGAEPDELKRRIAERRALLAKERQEALREAGLTAAERNRKVRALTVQAERDIADIRQEFRERERREEEKSAAEREQQERERARKSRELLQSSLEGMSRWLDKQGLTGQERLAATVSGLERIQARILGQLLPDDQAELKQSLNRARTELRQAEEQAEEEAARERDRRLAQQMDDQRWVNDLLDEGIELRIQEKQREAETTRILERKRALLQEIVALQELALTRETTPRGLASRRQALDAARKALDAARKALVGIGQVRWGDPAVAMTPEEMEAAMGEESPQARQRAQERVNALKLANLYQTAERERAWRDLKEQWDSRWLAPWTARSRNLREGLSQTLYGQPWADLGREDREDVLAKLKELRSPLDQLRDQSEYLAMSFGSLAKLFQEGSKSFSQVLSTLLNVAGSLSGMFGNKKMGGLLGNMGGIFGAIGSIFGFDTAEQDMRPRRWGWDFAAAFGQGLDSGMSQILAPARRRAERAAAGALAGRGDTHITVYNYGDLHRDVEVEAIGSSVASIFRRTLATT